MASINVVDLFEYKLIIPVIKNERNPFKIELNS